MRRLLSILLCCAACGDGVLPPGPPTSVVAGGEYAGTPGWWLDAPISVGVSDDNGQPVAGALVRWRTTEEGAWLEADSSYTNAAGTATMRYAPGHGRVRQEVVASVGAASASIPVTVRTLDLVEIGVAGGLLGPGLSCGLDSGGRLWCWRRPPQYPYLTQPALVLEDEYRPRLADPERRYRGIVGGAPGPYGGKSPICALSTSDRVRCWGSDDLGTDGLVAASESTPPVSLHLLQLSSYRGGTSITEYAICGLDSSGAAWCRGRNLEGQLGNATWTPSEVFTEVAGGHSFVSLSGVDAQFCGVTGDGRTWCWGRGGLVPDSTGDMRAPVEIPDLPDLVWAGPVEGGGCGISATREMTCWGRSYVAGEGGSLVPRPVPGATGVIQVISSGLHAWHRWNDGRVGFTGDLAHYFVPYSGLNFGFHREPLPHPFLSGAIAHLTGFDGSRWCAVHANGLVTCSYMFSRPLGVPLPVEP